MYKNIIAVAKNTFRETVRDRILLSGLLVIVAMILFTLFIGSISLDQGPRMIIDFSITAIYALQMFVAIFIGSMLIYKEIERKTFYLLLPKPITRTEIIIGKCLGLTATTIIVTLLSTSVLFAILYMQIGKFLFIPIATSVFLSTLEAVLLILISMLFSGITSPIMAAISTISIYFIGHAENIFRYIFMTTESPTVGIVTRTIYYLMPNFEKFNSRNDIVYQITPSPKVLLLTIVYTVVYAAILLLVTHLAFKKKDF
jgi:ABC-type transport system involved in multi-copper enzyme maturation permease subunit